MHLRVVHRLFNGEYKIITITILNPDLICVKTAQIFLEILNIIT